jgi:hypothetical protein
MAYPYVNVQRLTVFNSARNIWCNLAPYLCQIFYFRCVYKELNVSDTNKWLYEFKLLKQNIVQDSVRLIRKFSIIFSVLVVENSTYSDFKVHNFQQRLI